MLAENGVVITGTGDTDGFRNEVVAGSKIDLIAIGNLGIRGTSAGLAVHAQFLNGHRALVNCCEEGAGVDVINLSLVTGEVRNLSVNSINALFQADDTTSGSIGRPDKCLAVDPNLDTDVFHAVDHNILGLILKQDVVAQTELPEVPVGVAENIGIMAMAGQLNTVIGETQHHTAGPFRVLNRSTEVEHNNIVLFNVDQHGDLLIIHILRGKQAGAGMTDSHRLRQKLAGGNALDSNREALLRYVTEGVADAVDNGLYACGHGSIVCAGLQFGDMLSADDFHGHRCIQIAVLGIVCSGGGQNNGLADIHLNIGCIADGQIRSNLITVSHLNSKFTVTQVTGCILCQVHQGIDAFCSRRIAAADLYGSAVRQHHVDLPAGFAGEGSGGDGNRFITCKNAGVVKLHIHSGRRNVNIKRSLVGIINNQTLDPHMVIVVGSLSAVSIHGEPAGAGLIPQFSKQFVGQNALVNGVTGYSRENEVCVLVAYSGRLIDPAIDVDSCIGVSSALAYVLPLQIQGMILAIQQRLIIGLDRGHFLIAVLLYTRLNTASTNSQEQVRRPSAGFLIGHGVSVLAATGCNGVEHLAVQRRSIRIEGKCHKLLIDLCHIFRHANGLIQFGQCAGMTKGHQAEVVDPGHTQFPIQIVAIQSEVFGIQCQIHFIRLCDYNRNFISSFKGIAGSILHRINQDILTGGNPHCLGFLEVLPSCKQNLCRLAVDLFVQAGSDQAGNIHIAGLVNGDGAGQCHIGASLSLNDIAIQRGNIQCQGACLVVGLSRECELLSGLVAGSILYNVNDFVNQQLVGAGSKGLCHITGLLIKQITIDSHTVFLHLRNRHFDVGGNITVHIISSRRSRYSYLFADLAGFRNAGNSNDRSYLVLPGSNNASAGICLRTGAIRRVITGSKCDRHHRYHQDS